MQQTTFKLVNLKSNAYSNKKLYSSISSSNGIISNYLKLNLKQIYTSVITKFQVSAHTLNIERGRYARPKIPRDEKTCKFCNKVESETHFSLFCKNV